MPSDHWYDEVFRAMPDLVCRLLPGLVAEPQQESTYIFRPVTLKKVALHIDGLLWRAGRDLGGSAGSCPPTRS
ncbi:hypothetical protein LBMAG40_11110 [Cyanobium sp.]|nr:hypothetical protein LBMAG40_11110 [Cyanobium sp.]